MRPTPLLVPALLAALLLPAMPAAAQEPGACVGSWCPPGSLACVNTIDPRLDFCVVDPTTSCFTVVWLDQRVGPYHVWASGCTVHVEEEGGWDLLA